MRCAALVGISALLVLHGAPAVAQVYKCQGPAGAVQFSDKPCGGGMPTEADRVEVKPVEIGGSFGVSKEQQEIWSQRPARAPRVAAPPARNYCKSYSSTALRAIVVGRGVEPGMTMGDVQRSWGAPARVNGGRPTQWVYYWRDRTSYVYFEDGCVWRVDGVYGG